MNPKIKTAVLIAGFAFLAIFAVAGWTRNPNGAGVAGNNFANPSGVYTAANPADPNRPIYGYSQPAYAQPPVAGYAPAAYNCNEPVYTSAAYAPDGYNYPRYQTYNRPRIV